jgi:hypothetical protein
MAYFAKIKDGIVESVIAVNNNVLGEPEKKFPETEEIGANFIKNILFLDGDWKQTSYNNSFRGRYASIGYTYDSQGDIFIPPKPFQSWILNTSLLIWFAPIEMPSDGKSYDWDESTLSWKEIINDPN